MMTLRDFYAKWATKIIAEKNFRQARDIIINIFNFSNLIQEFPLGSKSSNMEIAIAGYEVALKIFNRYDYAEIGQLFKIIWQMLTVGRIKGERGENIEKAIAFYEAALQVYTRDAFPQDWAGLKIIWQMLTVDRIKGERGENIEKAIAFYEAALEVRTRAAFPQDWADDSK
jgi:tetratricopeptide (TPR) repeat protein